jgi:hypothetical protein
MVEASLVIPVILLSIVMLISVITGLFEKTTLRYLEHRDEMVQEENQENMEDAKRMADFMKGLV